MAESLKPQYTRHHPKWYRRRMPIFWWLGKLSYFRFIARELTALAVGYCALLLLYQVWVLAQGREAYLAFRVWLEHPAVLAIHSVVLLAVLGHAITWFSLTPQALVVRLAGRRVPGGVVLAAHYLAWVGASSFVAWLLLGG